MKRFSTPSSDSVRPPVDGDAATEGTDESRVRHEIAQAIYEHRIPPGTKLPEMEVARILGTSRGTLRKALDRLASEHLVDQIPNRGAFVAKPSVETTRDVYALRRILEAGVVRALSKCDCRPWINSVRLQVDEEREANRAGDTSRYIRLAGKFHLDLAAATGNAALQEHLQRVVSQTSLMIALYDLPGTNTCSVHEHLEILEAFEAGNSTEAERLMEEHLLSCERQLRLGDEVVEVNLAQALRAGHKTSGISSAAQKSPPTPSAAVVKKVLKDVQPASPEKQVKSAAAAKVRQRREGSSVHPRVMSLNS
jgi:DNA-binding GntR family transcriptional regulator